MTNGDKNQIEEVMAAELASEREAIEFLVGTPEIFAGLCKGNAPVLEIYSELVRTFLDNLSHEIRNISEMKSYPDILSFAFWCRGANIRNLKLSRGEGKSLRLGRGMTFHIAPSNVPINFAFSLAFGLLSGNSNVVRVSTKAFPQVKLLCDCLESLLCREEFSCLRRMICIVRYEKDSSWNARLSAACAARMLWGGDSVIQMFSHLLLPPRAVELHFADRYSFAILSPEAVLQTSDEELRQLAHGFYNDTYLFDQNACSSPHLICWKKQEDSNYLKVAQSRFWNAVAEETLSAPQEEKKSVDRLVLASEWVMKREEIVSWERYGSRLSTMRLASLPSDLEALRGRYGVFLEYELEDYRELAEVLTDRTQTCLYYGIDPAELSTAIVAYSIHGIDRIVPIGRALDISVFWDGFDVIGVLSRVINIEKREG